MLFKKILAVLGSLLAILPAMAQLQVINSSNAQALAQSLVGTGVTISNVSMTGAPISTGFFVNFGSTQLGLDSGIVLTSGRAQTALTFGLNGAAVAFASTSNSTPGDANLQALIPSFTTYDAAVLEFDFVPMGDSIEFKYVFSSEEYPEFACSNFNDVFAFFISGPGITGTRNLAIVPGTNIPVTINSINDGFDPDPTGLCSGMGAGSPFVQYYIDNQMNNMFTHDGHTVVMKAASAVIPCQTYHLKIAIADVGDQAYDSGVFLEAQSLRSDPVQIETNLPTFNGQPYIVEGCQPGAIKILRSKKELFSQVVNLSFGGNAINGTDVQQLPSAVTIPANDSLFTMQLVPVADNIPEGMDSLMIYVSSGCQLPGLSYVDSIVIYIRDYDTLAISPSDTVICNNASVQFNVTGNFSSIQWLPATGLNNPAIANPIGTIDSAITYIVTAGQGTCMARDSVALRVKTLQLRATKNINCKNGTTGEIRVSGGADWKAPVQYTINNQPFGADSSFLNLPAGNYVVRVKDASGCMDSLVINLVQAFPDLDLTDSLEASSCSGLNGNAFLTANGGLPPYSFAVDAQPYSSVTAYSLGSGNHTLYVQDANGCITSKPVVVTQDPPITFTATPSLALCTGSPSGYVYISATGGSGLYEYSQDGINYQSADSLLVSTSSVTITVRDHKGCTVSNTISLPVNQPIFVNAGNDTTICQGKSVQLNASYNATSISWAPSPDLSATNIPNPIATPGTTATYFITVTRDVCIARDTLTVTVRPAPLANAGADSTICFGKTISLSGSGGIGYSWLPTAGLNDPTLADPEVQPVQTTAYYLQVTDINGCQSLKFDTVLITVTPPLQVFAGMDTFLVVGQPLQLQGVVLNNTGPVNYTWTPALGLNDPLVANPIAVLNSYFIYTLTVHTP